MTSKMSVLNICFCAARREFQNLKFIPPLVLKTIRTVKISSDSLSLAAPAVHQPSLKEITPNETDHICEEVKQQKIFPVLPSERYFT